MHCRPTVVITTVGPLPLCTVAEQCRYSAHCKPQWFQWVLQWVKGYSQPPLKAHCIVLQTRRQMSWALIDWRMLPGALSPCVAKATWSIKSVIGVLTLLVDKCKETYSKVSYIPTCKYKKKFSHYITDMLHHSDAVTLFYFLFELLLHIYILIFPWQIYS